jgi:hypothetical protein
MTPIELMASKAGRVLCDRAAEQCGVHPEDNWLIYGEYHVADAAAILEACGAADLLEACKNARDVLVTDRQAFVDCQQLRDLRTESPIEHGLVAVADGVWLDSDDAEALRDYDRAIELIDAALAKAGAAQ